MKKDLTDSLAWGGAIVALAVACSVARNLGYIDQDMTTRIVIVATGLMIVSFGNRIPKRFTPNAGLRKAQRVAAWSMVISGLIYAGVFLCAPLDLALLIGSGAVILGILVTLVYCLSLRNLERPA